MIAAAVGLWLALPSSAMAAPCSAAAPAGKPSPYASAASPSETRRDMSGKAPCSIETYSRQGSTVTLAVPVDRGIGTAKMLCDGGPDYVSSGGWKQVLRPVGQCIYEVCYETGPSRPPITKCDKIKDGAINVNSAPIHLCPSGASEHNGRKGFCVFDTASPPEITGKTHDDMIRIEAGAEAFFESQNLGAAQRLRWLEWISPTLSQDLMMPSGPPGTYEDLKGFLHDPPAGIVKIEPACYATRFSACDTPPSPPPVAGMCGPALEGYYKEQPPQRELCYLGMPSEVQSKRDGWEWKCSGVRGGDRTNCNAFKPVDGECGPADGKMFHTVSEVVGAGQCREGKPSSSPKYDGSKGWTWRCDPPGYPDPRAGKSASCRAKQPPNTRVASSCLTVGIGGTTLASESGVPLRLFDYNFAYGWNIPGRFNFTGPGQPGYGYVSHELHFWIDDVTKLEHMGLGEANWEDYMRVYISNSSGSHLVWDSQWFNGKPWLESTDLNHLWTLPSGYYFPWKQYLRNGENVLLLQNLTVGKGQMWVDVGYFCNPYK